MKTASFIVCILLLLACNSKPKSPGAELAPEGGNPIAILNQQIQKDSLNPSLYVERANLYYAAEGYDEAISDLQKALSFDSTNIGYLHLLADVYLDYYRSREALATMYRAAELYPDRIPTLLKLSEFQHILKRSDQAIKTTERILAIDGQNAEAYFMRGIIYKEGNDSLRAIDNFQTAVEWDPDLADAWHELGLIFEAMGNPRAQRQFETAVRVDSSNMNYRLALANHLSNKNQILEAIAVYKEITRITPQFADAYYNAGLNYMDIDSMEAARTQFDIAVKTDPIYVEAYYFRGLCAQFLGDLESAASDYQNALNLNPTFKPAEEALQKVSVLQ